MRSLFRAINARRPTLLKERVMQQWHLNDIEEAIAIANAAPDFPALTPMVVTCAEEGDEVALEVLQRGGRELAGLALQAIDHLRDMEGPEQFVLPQVAFTGSVVQRVALLRNAMIAELRRVEPKIEVFPEAVDPVAGAVWQARHMPI